MKQSRAQAFIFEVKFKVNFIFKAGTHCAARLSGLSLSKVRSEGRPSRSSVQQALILQSASFKGRCPPGWRPFLIPRTHYGLLTAFPRGIAAAAYAKNVPPTHFLNAAGPPVALPSSASAKLYFLYRKSTQNPGIIAIPGFFLLIWFDAI